MSLINKEKLESEMYHNAFEIDTDLQKWDSGCWIRYKMFENVIEEQPEVKAIPLDKPFCKMVYGDYVCYNRNWLMKHLPMELDILQGKAIPVEQLLSILPKYDDYIHTKTYPYNETMEDIYSKGHEEGWNACLKAIKEELEEWEKENETN